MSTTRVAPRKDGKRRVVVTGLGPVTPIGIGKDAFWKALLEGRCGVGPITRFDPGPMGTKIAAEVKDFDPADFLDRKEVRRTDRFCHFALAAAQLAVDDAGLGAGAYPPERIGVLIGSGIGGIEWIEREAKRLETRGPNAVSPFFIPAIIVNMASGLVAMRFGYRGPNSAVATACATATHAIGDAYEIIARGEADAMIAGGSEAAITPLGMAGFDTMKAMSRRNDDPATASRPFDAGRDGFVMGEGAGIVVLEEREAARARGAPIYAEVVGYGCTGDAYHITSPDPEGAGVAEAMRRAIASAGRTPDDFDYVNAHGTSTPLNDKYETFALKKVFGERAKKIVVSSTKSMTGHLIGAAGGIETIACALALTHQTIPPTTNLTEPDPACDLDYCPNEPRKAEIRACLNNNLGFGGHNAVLALARNET